MNEGPDRSAEEIFAEKAKRRFEESVERMDGATRSRLNQARHAALAEAGARPAVGIQWATGVAAAGLVAVLVWTGDRPPEDAGAPAVADIEILLTEDSLEMLEDLEFYSWIDLDEESEMPPEPENHVG